MLHSTGKNTGQGNWSPCHLRHRWRPELSLYLEYSLPDKAIFFWSVLKHDTQAVASSTEPFNFPDPPHPNRDLHNFFLLQLDGKRFSPARRSPNFKKIWVPVQSPFP